MLTRRENSWLQMVNDELAARRDEICRGTLTHDEYKELCGYLRGLTTAIDIYNGVLKQEGDN